MTKYPLVASAIYGRLTFIANAGHDESGKALWLCRCECGIERIFDRYQVTIGKTKSCGCLRNDILKTSAITHGMSGTSLHNIWTHMKQRCLNAKHPAYADYGGRGITICDRWKDDFLAFVSDMGQRPIGMTIDRIDNDGGYEPGNCRWAAQKQQTRNKRGNRLITIDGETKCLAEWCEIAGIPIYAAWQRLERGWSEKEAFFKARIFRGKIENAWRNAR